MYFFRLSAIVLLAAHLITACQSTSSQQADTAPTLPTATQLSGQALSQRYCGSCHLYPEPALLDKKTWQKGVLPQMALRMGLSNKRMTTLTEFSDAEEMTRVLAANVLPETPMMHPSDWEKIVAFYTAQAPDKPLPQPAHVPLTTGLPLFRPTSPTPTIDGFVTLLTYDSLTNRIWAGDGRSNNYALDKTLHRVDSIRLSSPATDRHTNADGSADWLTVGMLNPNDKLSGMWSHQAQTGQTPKPQINQLERPVQASPVDLNRDGRPDLVVCQFGHYTGKLTWHERLAKPDASGSLYREHVLEALPGARLSIVHDMDKDGWPDIVALLTQGDEQVVVYHNLRNGTFRKLPVLRFPPVYGSSYLELTDMNRDGIPDLVYTNGDNADYSPVLKAYHGVRVFLNDGTFHFNQAWFYPLHGASQTVTRDFDQDGDLDIAAIAHFPDFSERPYAGFVYFENTGKMTFTPRTFPEANRGRWLRMTSGDIDQDGDEDLILGSFFKPTSADHADLMNNWRKPGAGLMLLENTLKK
ncbi:FG-GAP repeat domain-containing protein [Spirosoma rigui]|uniref:FG-GAP repeat domain-containing protein n=1 Tax=Spirosoma rigui TaxID=564064 RepID=UPI0009AF820A|nr:VCBS repeat-containing protein [Spirosoma rigui]